MKKRSPNLTTCTAEEWADWYIQEVKQNRSPLILATGFYHYDIINKLAEACRIIEQRESYKRGKRDGYKRGKRDGSYAGYKVGYSAGYEDGRSDEYQLAYADWLDRDRWE